MTVFGVVETARPKKLGLLPLVASTFFMVSGGAYGLEDLVACGYFVAISVLLVVPLLWSVPTALMVGELASALPKEGGYYAWVRRAIGPFWGFQEAWLSLVASFFDMALYPTLFTLYLGYLVPSVASGAGAIVAGAIVIAACAAWNMRGAAAVGGGAIALGVALLLPFAAFGVFALARGPAASSVVASPAHPAPALLAGLLVAMWNYMGWDNASTIAEEVERPTSIYPRAVFATLGLVIVTYLFPVCAAAWAGLDASTWTTGSWVTAAREVGGPSLAFAVVAGGMVCGAGMFNALLLSYSRLPVVLADDGFLPAWLSRRNPKNGAPWASIVVCSITYAACVGIGFIRLVELDVLLYGASLLLEFVALVTLRIREPDLARPFRIPGGPIATAALGIAPLSLLGLALWHCRSEKLGPFPSLGFGALLIGLGPIVYALRRRISSSASTNARNSSSVV
ncbi:MAG TPA: APC family permease [Polyangiaceae bacterium]|nr:APC family permease [Polyangiaceae bacterium]